MLALLSVPSLAQQTGVGSKAPTLTTDDVMQPSAAGGLASEWQPTDIGADGWARYTLFKHGVSLELPDALTGIDIPLPPEVYEKFREMKGFYSIGDEVYVVVLYAEGYEPTISTKDLMDFTAGFVQALTRRPGVAGNGIVPQQVSPSRVAFKGSFGEKGMNAVVDGFSEARGSVLWLVTTSYFSSNLSKSATAETDARRILGSLRFE
jgi:hypothetical protein